MIQKKITANTSKEIGTRISTKDYRGYNAAMRVADMSNCRYKMGCVIMRGGNMLSMGFNVLKTHTKHVDWPNWVCSIHAEHAAILRSRCDLHGSTLYVARLGGSTISKPCPMCTAAIELAGIREVVYSNGKDLVKIRV